MNEILLDTSPSALITAIEDNTFDFVHSMSKWPQAEVYDGDDIKWSITRIPYPVFNSVFRARLAAHQVDATIQTVIERARARNVPVLWWTGPQTQPSDLGMHLVTKGFAHSDDEPGMAANLMRLNEGWPVPPGLSIQRVGDAETLREWCQACSKVFGMADFVADAFFDFINHVGFGTSIPYLGLLEGKPVATSLVVLAGGVAGIYNVGTVPEARRKGIGTWMTLTPLRDARAKGYRVGVLQASEMGASVYRRLGFQDYCQIGHYLWSPAPG